MKRRALLKAVGASTVVGSSSLGGCLGTARVSVLGDRGDCETDHRWCYGVGGELDAVEDGTLFGRTHADGSRPGQVQRDVVALDADTGERQWAFGPISSEMDTYTDLAVQDGVYFSWCTDEGCKRLYAFEPDGEERWTRDIDAGYWRPVVADGTVYVGGHAPVRAIDAATGETRWTHQERSGGPSIVDVGDAVYLESMSGLVALDRNDGSERWRYDVGERTVTGAAAADGLGYVVTFDGVDAVADGEQQWRRDFDEDTNQVPEITAITSDRLFVRVADDRHEHRLYVFDRATGERAWTTEQVDYSVAVRGDVVYVDHAHRLRALDAATGSERWSKDFDSGQVGSVTVAEDTGAPDHTVFVEFGESQFAGFTPDGEQTWEGSVDGEFQDLLVDEHVFVATDEAIYALDRGDGS